MKPAVKKGLIAAAVCLFVVVFDQLLKIWVKTNLQLGDQIIIFDWFRIAFVENNGMAFGMELGSKLFLTLFRVVLVVLLTVYVCRLVKRKGVKTGYIICVALIIAGALGNIIDCVFYGVAWGYTPLFYGKVVDMLYFPLFSFVWPDWMPFVGGNEFEFFQPVFNIADSAITIGILTIIIFYYRSLTSTSSDEENKKAKNADTVEESVSNDEQ
ncbi:MAG: lipoprotein signal peptidase [Muribaculaceae bacterium]|nr:lipoprotein signal peptidase [Muribaculaceae bacterium]